MQQTSPAMMSRSMRLSATTVSSARRYSLRRPRTWMTGLLLALSILASLNLLDGTPHARPSGNDAHYKRTPPAPVGVLRVVGDITVRLWIGRRRRSGRR